MEPRLAKKDVVVVGGGVAGLTAAGYLARAGADVTVFERARESGGRAATRERDGFLFNRGGHALYTGGAATEVFRELGVAYDFGVPKDTFVLQDGTISPFPADPLGLLRTGALDAGDKLALFRFLVALGRARPRALAGTTVQEWLDARIKRPRLHRVVAAFARSFCYTSALDLASAEMFVEKFQRSFRHPIHYVEGGWRVLTDGLRASAEAAGARIVTGTGVEGVEVSGDRVRGVRLRHGFVPASAVVLATEARHAARLVDETTHPALRKMVDGLTPVPVACLDVALRRLPVPERPVVQDVDSPRFASAQSVYIPGIAPEGGALVISFKQLDPRRPGDPREDERDLEVFLDQIQPGWREVLVRRQYLPRLEAVGALPTAPGGGFAGRPDVRVPGLEGLYLAGDWVGPEGFLIDASAASARAAARSVEGASPRASGPPLGPPLAHSSPPAS